MMTVSFRTATLADVPQLLAIDQASNPHAWTHNQFSGSLNDAHSHVLLVEKNREVVAFIVWQTVCDESELHLIATHPQHRQCGYASELLVQMQQHAQQNHVKRIFLEVRHSNFAAQKLYVKHGFQVVAQRKHYYGDEHALIMEKSC